MSTSASTSTYGVWGWVANGDYDGGAMSLEQAEATGPIWLSRSRCVRSPMHRRWPVWPVWHVLQPARHGLPVVNS